MFKRWVFTLDPENYPLAKVRELVDYLHAHHQHYIVMVCSFSILASTGTYD